MDNELLRERLIELRKEKGQNRKDAAAQMGIPYRTLTCYEQGDRVPRPEQILIMADYYGVTVDELLGVRKSDEDDQKKEIDFDEALVVLKDAGLVAEDRRLTEADIRFLESIICQIEYWFE